MVYLYKTLNSKLLYSFNPLFLREELPLPHVHGRPNLQSFPTFTLCIYISYLTYL